MKKFEGVLLAADIDGTLSALNEIPRRNIEAIRSFQDQGGLFTACTGRDHSVMYEIVRQIPFDVPAVCINGMHLYDFRQERDIHRVYLPEQAKQITADIMEHFPDIGVIVVAGDKYTIIREGCYALGELRERIDFCKAQGLYVDGTLTTISPMWMKVLYLVNAKRMQEVTEYFQENWKGNMKVIPSSTYFLEMVLDGCDKGTGLVALKKWLGGRVRWVAAVGDNYNDLDMFREADFSAAVQEASSEIKSHVDFIAGPYLEGAVADVIEYLEGHLEELMERPAAL